MHGGACRLDGLSVEGAWAELALHGTCEEGCGPTERWRNVREGIG